MSTLLEAVCKIVKRAIEGTNRNGPRPLKHLLDPASEDPMAIQIHQVRAARRWRVYSR